MDLKVLGSKFPIIKRSKHLPCGLVAEIKQPQQTDKDWQNAMYRQISDYIWESDKEVIYALYFFKSLDEQFPLEGILRTKESDYAGEMPTSYLGADDIFGQFTRFDFDCLTLSNQNDMEDVKFRIARGSPSEKPNSLFKELDLEGFQFAVSAKAHVEDPANGIYKINVAAENPGNRP